MDVVFLMDSSKDVNFINFIKEKAYVKLLAKRLNVSPGKSRAAVVVYGSSSQLKIDFDAYDSLSAFETAEVFHVFFVASLSLYPCDINVSHQPATARLIPHHVRWQLHPERLHGHTPRLHEIYQIASG